MVTTDIVDFGQDLETSKEKRLGKETRNICVTAMGVALFVVLSMCLRVPILENYYV